MLTDTLRFLVGTLANFFTLVLLLRFYFQLARVPFNHPLAQFTVALTNFVVLPTRRFVPSIGGWDTSTLVLAWLTELLSMGGVAMAEPHPICPVPPAELGDAGVVGGTAGVCDVGLSADGRVGGDGGDELG